jgi:hypothetical protein
MSSSPYADALADLQLTRSRRCGQRERLARVGEMTERTISGTSESMHDDRQQRDVQWTLNRS